MMTRRISWLEIVAVLLVLGPALTGRAAAAADVSFQGAKSFSAGELNRAIAVQLDEISASGLSPSRADDAAWMLGSHYRKQGFPKASVTYEIRGSGLVLNIAEGDRAVIQSLTFSGSHVFPDKTLFEYMFGIPQERLAQAKQPYEEGAVAAGADRVRDLYVSEGFVDVAVDTSGTSIRPGGRHADVVVRIVEGKKYTLGEITFRGKPIFGRQELLEAADAKSPAFTPFVVDEMHRRLESFYRSKGYFLAKVIATGDVTLAREGRVPVVFDCEPGNRYKVGRVESRGMQRLSGKFMEKRFASMAGKVYDPARIEERYRELINTGLFKSLHVRPVPDGPDTLKLDVEIEESKTKELGFDLGYGSYDGMSAGVSVGDRNFLGYGRPLAVGIQYSQRGLGGELSYLDPWFLDSLWAVRARVYSQVRDEQGYSKLTNGLRLDLSRTVLPRWKVGGYFVAEFTDISKPLIDETLIGPTKYFLMAAGLSQTIDYRNDELNPTRGWVFTTLADVDALDGEFAFARVASRYSCYRSFGRSLLGVGVRCGWIIPVNGGQQIPIDLRYFNGGANTVRSFAERQLGPEDRGGNPMGGQFYSVANIEWDFPIAGALGGALFVDAGNLSSASSISFDDMRYAIGAGLRYQLPIGPVRIDYGYNPAPKQAEKAGAFHLSFGFAF